MDKEQILKIVGDVKNKPNKELIEARDFLITEFNKTKSTIIELTQHLNSIESFYIKINDELGERVKE
jgi:hypothetical protein